MKWKAIIIGVISYPILWTIWAFLSPQYEHQSIHTYSLVMAIFYWLMPLFSGLLSGQFAKINSLKHGLVVGIILAGISLGGWLYLEIMNTNMLLNLAGIIILSTLGGGLSQGIKWLLMKKSK